MWLTSTTKPSGSQQRKKARLARLTFENRGNKGSLRLTEQQFSGYIAVSFEAGAYWALKQAHK
ncbi:MAG: hypothetical protein J2P13_03595 [Acidobacteria bacterium]|nr:hypothetical protein [Acidobacteriota bacterium]